MPRIKVKRTRKCFSFIVTNGFGTSFWRPIVFEVISKNFMFTFINFLCFHWNSIYFAACFFRLKFQTTFIVFLSSKVLINIPIPNAREFCCKCFYQKCSHIFYDYFQENYSNGNWNFKVRNNCTFCVYIDIDWICMKLNNFVFDKGGNTFAWLVHSKEQFILIFCFSIPIDLSFFYLLILLRKKLTASTSNYEQRDFVIRELIDTESNYLDVLHALKYKFMQPMEKLLSREELKMIYPKIKVKK